MGGRFCACVAVCWAAAAALASAQPATPSAPAAAPVTTPVAEAPKVAAQTPEHDLAAELYDLAFDALAAGQTRQAHAILSQLHAQFPEQPLGARAEALLATLAAAQAPVQAPVEQPAAAASKPPSARPTAAAELPGEKPSSTARAELAFFQTLHGLALGVEACVMLECEEPQPWVGAMMGGAGLGLGASLLLSRDGVTPGLARALTSGVEWGAWHALALGYATDAFDGGYYYSSGEEVRVATGLVLGQLAGLGVGLLAYHGLSPSAGQVSLTSSGGIWLGAAAGLGLVIGGSELDENTTLGVLWIAGDIGLLAGAVFASREPMSAGRVLLLDASGLLGTLTGAGLAVLASNQDVEPEPAAGFALLGMTLGLGLGYFLTEDWDADEEQGDGAVPEISVGVLPTQGGAMAHARATF